jgi:hypothetical protein
MSHVHTRKSLCPRMLANSFCGDPDSSDSNNKGHFRSFSTMHSSHILREGVRPKIVRDNMSHAKTPATPSGWQGYFNHSDRLLRVEEIGERLRVRRSHAGRVIPARSCLQAGVRTE